MKNFLILVIVAELIGCSNSFITELSQLSSPSKRFHHFHFATTASVDPKLYVSLPSIKTVLIGTYILTLFRPKFLFFNLNLNLATHGVR
jgi:hypothetical protein